MIPTKPGKNQLWSLALVATVLVAGLVPASASSRFDPETESRVGAEVAAQVDKEYDRVDNAEALANLQRMAETIAANTPRPEVKYDVRLVREKKQRGDKPEENAFSLPGGIIYVTEGLLKAVHSDHELAAVMAHEIAHNVHYDGLTQADRANKIIRGEMAAVLAAILIGGIDSEAWGHVMQAGMFFRHGVLGGYSIDMERAADKAAVRYMLDTPWDPVGLLTFMERLAAQERRSPPREMGIFQTHPLSTERVRYLTETLHAAGIHINRRKTTEWERPQVKEQTVKGKPAHVVLYHDQVIFAVPQDDGGAEASLKRAEAVRDTLTEALAQGAGLFTFSPGDQDGRPALMAWGEPVFVVTPAEAELAGKDPEQVVKNSHMALGTAIRRESLGRLYGG